MSPERALILETCLLAGRVMLENGSEVYRVEDTMLRISTNAGETGATCYITITGIFMGFNHDYTQMESIGERAYNLEKVTAVNHLSREFAEEKIDLQQLHDELNKVDVETPHFPFWLQLISAGIVSATLMYILGGNWVNFFPTFLIGIAGFWVSVFVAKHSSVLFFNIFSAAVTIGLLAVLFRHWFPVLNINHMIIGGVMPLVPGVAITNSFRDILAGHLISGLSRGTEAIIVATAIGVGIAFVLMFLGGALY